MARGFYGLNKSLVSGFLTDRPIKINVKKFFQPLSEKTFFAYRLVLRGQKKKEIYKSPTNRMSNALPKGRNERFGIFRVIFN